VVDNSPSWATVTAEQDDPPICAGHFLEKFIPQVVVFVCILCIIKKDVGGDVGLVIKWDSGVEIFHQILITGSFPQPEMIDGCLWPCQEDIVEKQF
jgi:hypothetical protein